MSRKLQLDSAIAADIQTVNADSYIDSLKMIISSRTGTISMKIPK